ncbi:MAG: hypothetical protein GF331_24420 [Chitinivibrionales bacterium]|nr:hypothetical protein [Chitinivibrionales bacterium]
MIAGLESLRRSWFAFLAAATFMWVASCAAEKQTDLKAEATGSQPATVEGQQPARERPDSSAESTAARTIVYYFHTSRRCHTCHLLETYAKQAVDSAFGDELQAGSVVFSPVNVEQEQNRHFMQDYKLHTKSVVVSVVDEEGEELRWKNLDQIWNLVRSEDKYKRYIVGEVRALTDGGNG